MSNYAQILGLDPVDAQNIAEAYEGYAGALAINENNRETLPWIASSLLISALFYAVVDPVRSKEVFSRAADSYYQLALPIWRLCSICSVDYKKLQSTDFEEYIETETFNYEDAFYADLQQLFTEGNEGAKNIYAEFKQSNRPQQYYSGKIPKINIPYSFVKQTIYDAGHWMGSEKYEYLTNFSELVRRLYEVTELYQADEYHWQNLQGSILPFEPAAIAIVLVFLKRWLVNNSFDTLLSNVKLNKQQQTLLYITYEMLGGRI